MDTINPLERTMTATRKILATAILALASNGAFAQAYVGINHAWAKESADELNFDVDHRMVILKGGYQFNDWLSAEARYGQSSTSEDLQLYYPYWGYLPTKYTLEQYYGGYVTATIPTGNAFKPYFVVGYSKAEAELSTRYGSISDSASDISYGAGLNFDLNERYAVNFEVMRFSDSDGEIDGVSFGLKARF